MHYFKKANKYTFTSFNTTIDKHFEAHMLSHIQNFTHTSTHT